MFAFGCAGSLRGPFSSRGDVVSRGYSLVAVRGWCGAGRGLIAVTSLVAEHGLQGVQASVAAAPRLWSTGSVVVAHGFSCSAAHGVLLDQGLNLCLLQ